jgi:outer membrane protein OmpA-like peptidoglycan-associated protein
MRVREPVGTVYFTFAGAQVSAAALLTVAAAVARAGRADRFVLTAYTDPYGSVELNRRLAALRAESVTAALAVRGVDPAQVVVLSRPQCCAVQPLPERDAALYRRVDIEILTHRAVLSEERGHGPQPHS